LNFPISYLQDPDAPVLTLVELGSDEPNYTSETYRDEDGSVIAQIVWDKKDQMVLFAIYPDVGGTVVITMSYDNQGNLTSEICTTYDENGTATDTVDMLAFEETQSLSASSESYTTMSLDSGGSYMMSSTPEGPQVASESFAYDHLGNRYQYTDKAGITWTYAHDEVNQYAGRETNVMGIPLEDSYMHDDNGNLETDNEGSSYSYDYRNRLVTVEDIESNTVAEFVYDALGRRVKKTVGTTVTYFFYDGAGQVIAEYERPDIQSPSLAREFVYGNSYNEVLAMFTPYHAGDPADWDAFVEFCQAWLCQDPNDACYDGTYDHDSDSIVNFDDFAYFASIWDIPSGKESNWYYLRDVLGSVRGLIGGRFNREADREFYNYDVYGKLSIQNPEKSQSGNPYLFAGYRNDPEIDLYNTEFRTYDPANGRWFQFDPINYEDAYNLYEYVGGR